VTRSKKMVLVFSDVKSVIYTNHLPKGKTVNLEYMKKILARLLVIFRTESPSCHPMTGTSCSTPLPQSRSSRQQKGSRQSAGPRPSGLFPLPEGEVGAGWTGQLPQSREGFFELWAASMSKNNSEQITYNVHVISFFALRI
jgi:hypothetical protein